MKSNPQYCGWDLMRLWNPIRNLRIESAILRIGSQSATCGLVQSAILRIGPIRNFQRYAGHHSSTTAVFLKTWMFWLRFWSKTPVRVWDFLFRQRQLTSYKNVLCQCGVLVLEKTQIDTFHWDRFRGFRLVTFAVCDQLIFKFFSSKLKIVRLRRATNFQVSLE